MVCLPGKVVAQPSLHGLELLVPETDSEFEGMISAQNEAYGEPATVSAKAVEDRRDLLKHGGLAVLGRNSDTGEPAGGAVGTALAGGSTELAGLGVRDAYRRRGLGAAMAEFLAREAHSHGGVTVFLTPAGVPEERMYARVGFVPAGECVHLRVSS